MTFKKISNNGGETYYDQESGVSYGWTFMSNANGSAFDRAHGRSGIFFRVKVNNAEVFFDRIGTARVMADARPIAREYLRNTGKGIAESIAEAAIINKYV